MKKVAKIILINTEKELLLHLRDNKPTISYAGYWALIGGEVKKGEALLQGLQREINEEIPDCEVKDIQELGDFLHRRPYTRIFIFKGKINEQIEYINQKLLEGQEAKYFSFDKLRDLKLSKSLRNFIYTNKDKIFN